MKTGFILAFVLFFILAACVPITINIGQPAATPTTVVDSPVTLLPDLAITSSIISMVDINGNCLQTYELTAILVNRGNAVAVDVVAEELMSGHRVIMGNLDPQQTMVLQFPASPNGRYRIMLDPQNVVMESDETNNIVEPPSVPATIPGYCLPGMIRTPTPPPYPVFTPVPTQINFYPNYFPMFSAPGSWLTHTQPYAGYTIQYPPEAHLDQYPERLIISLPFVDDTQMMDKSIWIETRPASQDECFTLIPWDGIATVNGLEMYFSGGNHWENAMGGVSFVPGEYAVHHNGICYRLSLHMGIRTEAAAGTFIAPTPGRADMDYSILLNIISTFRIP